MDDEVLAYLIKSLIRIAPFGLENSAPCWPSSSSKRAPAQSVQLFTLLFSRGQDLSCRLESLIPWVKMMRLLKPLR
ncbi:MAG: hypothetical protein RJB13_1222 [Pseudomonadota bacterium]